MSDTAGEKVAIAGGLIGCVVVGALAVSAALGALFWLVWNGVIVEAFHAPALKYWQAWGIWILIAMIGGAFRSVFTTKEKR